MKQCCWDWGSETEEHLLVMKRSQMSSDSELITKQISTLSRPWLEKFLIHEHIVLAHCSRNFKFQCVLHLQKVVDMSSTLHCCNTGGQFGVDIYRRLIYYWETHNTFCFVTLFTTKEHCMYARWRPEDNLLRLHFCQYVSIIIFHCTAFCYEMAF